MAVDKIKNWVGNIYSNYKEQYNKEPAFEDIIKDCIYLKGINITDYLFSSLKEGWITNNFPETDFRKLHKDIFCDDRNYYYSEIENYLIEESDAEMQISFDAIIESEKRNKNLNQ